MARTRDEILSSLKWSKSKRVNTKRGKRFVRSAKVTPEVLELWDREQSVLYGLGYSVTEYNGQKQISEWREKEEVQEDTGERTVESRLDRLSKTARRDLSKKHAPRGPMKGFLFGRPVEEVCAIMKNGWNADFTGPKS